MIRSQKKQRSNLPTGESSVLYYYFTPPDGTANYETIPDSTTLEMLKQEVHNWGNKLFSTFKIDFSIACITVYPNGYLTRTEQLKSRTFFP